MKTYRDLHGDGGSGIPEQVADQAARLRARMAAVRRVVAVASGKGGVGKSSVTVHLAAAFAMDGLRVGIVDADLNGPSIARMTGVRDQHPRSGPAGLAPAVGPLGIRVMSMDLLLSDAAAPLLWQASTQRDAFAWRGLMEAAALREFLADTAWGPLDVLLVDLPPGADRLPDLADLLPRLDGALVVTLPSGVAQFVVGKSLRLAETLHAPVLGVVENMTAYVCAHCGHAEALFPAPAQAAPPPAHGLPVLGRIPFDPRIAALADAGILYLPQHPTTPAGRALRETARRVGGRLGLAALSTPNHGE